MKKETVVLLCVIHQKFNLLELDRVRALADDRSGSTFEAYDIFPGGLKLGVAWIVVVDKNHDITRCVLVGILYPMR